MVVVGTTAFAALKMLNLLRSRCIAQSNYLASIVPFQSRWSSTVEHTLQVRKDIERQRELSRQGGGPKRIAGQHKKVCLARVFQKL